MYPDKILLASEACEGSYPDWIGTGRGTKLDNPEVTWKRAENYARDIIGDLQHFTGGWTDWNMFLDTNGGPTWVDKNVDAPILINTKTGDEFYLQPMYFILAHFSKFIPPNSVKVGVTAVTANKGLEIVAFRTPTNNTVVVIQNRKTAVIARVGLQHYWIELDSVIYYGSIEADAIQTILL